MPSVKTVLVEVLVMVHLALLEVTIIASLAILVLATLATTLMMHCGMVNSVAI